MLEMFQMVGTPPRSLFQILETVDEGINCARQETETLNMEQVDWSTLPSDLVEAIFCRIPFPEVLRVRELNNEWFSRFPKLCNLHQLHSKWPIYCPAFLCPGAMLGFDRSSNRWSLLKFDSLQKLLAESLEDNSIFQGENTTVEGPFLCTYKGPSACRVRRVVTGATITIVNLLSGRYWSIACPKQTMPCTARFCACSCNCLPWKPKPPVLRRDRDGSFRVLLWARHRDECLASGRVDCRLYNSKSNSWICRTYRTELWEPSCDKWNRDDSVTFASTSLDGDLYTLEGLFDGDIWVSRCSLLRVSVLGALISFSEESQSELDLRLLRNNVIVEFEPDGEGFYCADISVVRCGVRTIMTLILKYKYHSGKSFGTQSKLYEVHKNDSTFTARELSTSPILRCGRFWNDLFLQADDDCIYFCGGNLTSYHVELNSWVDHGNFPDAAFLPGYAEEDNRSKPLKYCLTFEPKNAILFQ
ncbi:hypothetical protein R1sor_026159 [Riccia sorocarpa]|uniref:F-box domain-containing protein n=1 Tax=Riccia sorocarpa TaxID=122646 RepID=A0ABD3GE97_9MARC